MPIGKAIEGLLESVGDALSGFTDSVKKAREQRAMRLWGDLLPDLAAQGLGDPSIEGDNAVGWIPGARLDISLHDNDHDGDVQTSDRRIIDPSLWERPWTRFRWTFDNAYDARVTMRTPEFLDQFGKASRRVHGLRVTERSEVVDQLLTDAVISAAAALGTQRVGFGGDTLTLEVKGHELDTVGEQIALVSEMVSRIDSRFNRIRALGLTNTGEGVWTGVVEGASVKVVEARKGKHFTTITHVALGRPFPVNTRMERKLKSKASRPRHKLGDWILDEVLSFKSTDLDAVKARVAREPARTGLLSLLGGFPRSRVTEQEIVIRRPGPVVGDCLLADALELREALDVPV